jgi:hypothetical protein
LQLDTNSRLTHAAVVFIHYALFIAHHGGHHITAYTSSITPALSEGAAAVLVVKSARLRLNSLAMILRYWFTSLLFLSGRRPRRRSKMARASGKNGTEKTLGFALYHLLARHAYPLLAVLVGVKVLHGVYGKAAVVHEVQRRVAAE